MDPVVPRAENEDARLRGENERLARRVDELERRLSLQPQSGLPTHFRLEVELEAMLAEARKAPESGGFSVVIIQLGEGYAAVRRTLKVSVSEWILYQTGCRIQSLLEPGDRLFHTRETEFVLLLPNRKGSALGALLKRLDVLLAEPHIFSGLNIAMKTAMGVAYWPEHAQGRSALMHHADIAVGAASEDGRKAILFRPELLDRAVEKVELQNSIIKAIEASALDRIGEQFFVCFQPKIFAESLRGRVLSSVRVEAEALIRWRHPRKGILMPATFIPLAEETGLILPLGKWLIYQCVRRLAAWSRAGRPDVSVSVNLSARQFMSGEAADTLAAVLAECGVDPSRVTAEITETGLFENPARAAVELARLRELGVKVSMDDFGTGYSSLSHIHRFPLDEIKIDKLFVEGLGAPSGSGGKDRVIVQSLVSLARGLELELVAEGVESPEALESLWDMGCRGFQGWLFGKPMLPADFMAFRDRVAASGGSLAF